MECISIIVPDSINSIKEMIDKETNSLKRNNVRVIKNEEDNLIKIMVYNNWQDVKSNFINIIYKYIVDNYEKKIIENILNTEYSFLTKEEKEEVYNISEDILSHRENIGFIPDILKVDNNDIIKNKIEEYLEQSKEIIIEGFVNFRLKEYKNKLQEIVEKAVDEYIMEKEYKDFLMLLNYFVEIQEPKIDTIHVIKNDNKYCMIDSNGSLIENNFVNDIACEMSKDNVDNEDLLISSLITFAPKKIIFHKSCNLSGKLKNMLKNIFPGKIIICHGCDICTKLQLN